MSEWTIFNNTTQFGLLSKDQQKEMNSWSHGWEYWSGPDWGWIDVPLPLWADLTSYRAKPAPLTKPSLDWSHVHEQFNHAAKDSDGGGSVFADMPEPEEWGGEGWWCSNGDWVETKGFASWNPGTCDWKDSLIHRPGFEPKGRV